MGENNKIKNELHQKIDRQNIQDIPDDDVGGGFKDSDFISKTKIQTPGAP